ncbi:serine hydrolase [Caulobacter sp. FWC2]|uniref:serine hydrolase domain-containing protein n=1 Tax=Caulobacter sp. FWC2 TaxID=69664 RepID=UPI000C14C17F|nr:serine hydrolase [Caulobacter sp. FWC2]PIB92579.1 serine hydrolase [Caulobacter sp. FWC2]
MAVPTSTRAVALATIVTLFAGAPAWGLMRPDHALAVAVGLTAQTLCAETFISGLPPERIFHDSVAARPGLNLIAWGLRYNIDQQRREVSASWLGLARTSAVHRGPAGCQLNHGRPIAPAPILAPIAVSTTPWIKAPADTRIEAALDQAFAEPAKGAHRVRAIVIVRDGQIVGERYGPGVRSDTALPGYSLTKTAIGALTGVAVRQGRLRMDQAAPVTQWRAAGDPRATITPNALLRMTSGLDAAETHSGFDPTSRMLFLEPDMAAYAQDLPAKQAQGHAFAYQSANTLILSRILANLAGGREADALSFVRRELFAPLGMTTAVLQTDAAGTPVGSEGMLASARDWARLGQLFMDDGIHDGRRILPEGWVAYATRPTLGGPYGAGLWLARASKPTPLSIITQASLPADAFYASGDLGQRIYILPSARLVVVRLAASTGPAFGIRADMTLLGALSSASD